MLVLKNLQILERLLASMEWKTVWNNCYISKQGNTLFYPQLCYKGIQYVRDILDDHGKIMNWQAARSKFDLQDKDFMVWLSLLKSIPVN